MFEIYFHECIDIAFIYVLFHVFIYSCFFSFISVFIMYSFFLICIFFVCTALWQLSGIPESKVPLPLRSLYLFCQSSRCDEGTSKWHRVLK